VKTQTIFIDAAGRPLPPEEQERLWQEQVAHDAVRHASQRESRHRLEAIARFKNQQAIERDWISIDDVVDWRSRDRMTGAAREDYRLAVLEDLDLAIRTGRYFFVDEQSRILLTFPFVDVPEALNSDPLKLPRQYWLSQADWLAQHELSPPQPGESEADELKRLLGSHLQWAWIPRELCLLWAENVPFEPRPEWLVHGTSVQSTSGGSGSELPPKSPQEAKRRNNNPRGRPKEYRWDDIKNFALDLIKKFGVPAEGNKRLPRNEDLVIAIQDEWAMKRNIQLAPSTVRRYVSKWLSEL